MTWPKSKIKFITDGQIDVRKHELAEEVEELEERTNDAEEPLPRSRCEPILSWY